MSFKKILVQFIFFYSYINGSYQKHDDFSYEGDMGPEHWGKYYYQCQGKLQTPININDINVEYSHKDDIIYEGFKEIPIRGKISNNGHTAVVNFIYEKNMVPRIRKGPLTDKGEFELEQLHFHWGTNNTVGSEFHINGKPYVAELHVVFRNNKYKTFKEATNRAYGLVVLACFFELQKETNAFLENIVDATKEITKAGTETFLSQPLPSLSHIMDTDLTRYYTYFGSLTTPPCSEYVIWIHFVEPLSITTDVIEHFRKLETFHHTYLTHNFRPIQPLNNRVIYKVVPNAGNPIQFYTKTTLFHINIFLLLLLLNI